MFVSYSDSYYVPLPAGHPFPMEKFPCLYRLLLDEAVLKPSDIVSPEPAIWEDLLLVHTPDYIHKLRCGLLSPQEERRMGLPWSPQLVRRSRLAVQGTINAARMALDNGVAGHLAGGTHHAFPDHGEGFCVLNDVAVAIRVLQGEGRIRGALVVDLDVHQGNGTAAVFANDEHVYTFSMHGERNYPFVKQRSSLDISLPDGITDTAYLELVANHLPAALAAAKPDMVFYLAGVDVVKGDRFGRLAITRHGLRQREQLVLKTMRAIGLPMVITLSGGYARTPQETADLHAEVFREAASRLESSTSLHRLQLVQPVQSGDSE